MSPGSTRTTTHLPNCFCQSDKAFEDHFYSINAISATLWNSAKVIITSDYHNASMKLPGLPMQWWQSIKVLHFKSLNAKFLWKWLHTQTVECVPQHLSEQFSTGETVSAFYFGRWTFERFSRYLSHRSSISSDEHWQRETLCLKFSISKSISCDAK